MSVNGKTARASYDVKVGDVIEIAIGANTTRVQVEKVVDFAGKDDAPLMYKVL